MEDIASLLWLYFWQIFWRYFLKNFFMNFFYEFFWPIFWWYFDKFFDKFWFFSRFFFWALESEYLRSCSSWVAKLWMAKNREPTYCSVRIDCDQQMATIMTWLYVCFGLFFVPADSLAKLDQKMKTTMLLILIFSSFFMGSKIMDGKAYGANLLLC